MACSAVSVRWRRRTVVAGGASPGCGWRVVADPVAGLAGVLRTTSYRSGSDCGPVGGEEQFVQAMGGARGSDGPQRGGRRGKELLAERSTTQCEAVAGGA